MESIAFRIEYHGPALNAHVMDVRVLAPSLLAFSDLCQESQRVLNGDSAETVHVNISATSEGCFGAVLELAQQAYNQIPFEYIAEAMTALKVGRNIFNRLQKNMEARRRQQAREEVRGKRIAALEDVSGKVIDTRAGYRDPAIVLALNLRFRMAHRQFLVPLELPGIDEIRLIKDGKIIETFLKEEVESGQYDIHPQEFDRSNSLIRPQVIEAVLQLRAPAFVRNRMWEFTYDDRLIHATIRDADFLVRVFEKEERFGAQDYFRVQMRITQELRMDGRIRNVYEILRVLGVNPIVPPMN